jgi:hypothetical protein
MPFGLESIPMPLPEREIACGKVRYPDKQAAQLAANLGGSRNKSRRTGGAKTPYFCNGCQGWHLTSNRLP